MFQFPIQWRTRGISCIARVLPWDSDEASRISHHSFWIRLPLDLSHRSRQHCETLQWDLNFGFVDWFRLSQVLELNSCTPLSSAAWFRPIGTPWHIFFHDGCDIGHIWKYDSSFDLVPCAGLEHLSIRLEPAEFYNREAVKKQFQVMKWIWSDVSSSLSFALQDPYDFDFYMMWALLSCWSSNGPVIDGLHTLIFTTTIASLHFLEKNKRCRGITQDKGVWYSLHQAVSFNAIPFLRYRSRPRCKFQAAHVYFARDSRLNGNPIVWRHVVAKQSTQTLSQAE